MSKIGLAKITVRSLEVLICSAENDIEYFDPKEKYVRKVARAIATAERAIKIAKLRAQPRHEKKK